MQIARIALPLPVDQLFSYLVPPELAQQMAPGSLVTVPFGRRRLVGVVIEEGNEADLAEVKARTVLDVADASVRLSDELLELTRWISVYYMCSWGEAVRAALPPGMTSPTRGPRTRTEPHVSLNDEAPRDPPRGERQQEIVHTLRILATKGQEEVAQSELLAETGGTSATLKRLQELGYLTIRAVELDRSRGGFASRAQLPSSAPDLHDFQRQAVDAIVSGVEARTFAAFLLHGVTGSGKTEVYLSALESARRMGRSGIVLVPEIALTPQTVARFRHRFGDEIAVLHSRMGPGERFDAWRGIRQGRYPIVIGPRSAILAPLARPGLIIVDEEHEASYKQFDPAPRYHARDVALVRARNADAVCVLGSATPGFESLHNARTGKYTLLSMPDRVPIDGVPARLPDIRIVDLRTAPETGSSPSLLSPQLIDALRQRVQRKEQSILLLNRRGFAPVMECSSCGWVPECEECSVSMVYHKSHRHLRCHYCGRTDRLPATCIVCGGSLEMLGAGTERLEEDLAAAVPSARMLRMDLDTTSNKDSHYRILDQFGRGEADILLGTQMVAKGLDFERVTLVGIVQADAGLHFPDLRAEERAFQLLTQVAGRSGRARLKGEVFLQTRQPGHRVIQHVLRHDYDGYAELALAERAELGYPPSGRLISGLFSGTEDLRVRHLAEVWSRHVEDNLPEADVLGPSPAFIHRVKRQYRHQVLVKLPLAVPASMSRDVVRTAGQRLGNLPTGYRLNIDVDPVGLI